MRPLKERISITIDMDVLSEIKLLAEKSGRSLSQYINRILQKHLRDIAEKKVAEDWDDEEL